jgi:exosortase E/protease (VPEID-CTERM system)
LRFPNALLLIPVALGVVWLANSLRIAALIAVGARYSADVALGGFHSKAGWLMFCALALGIVALARRSPFLAQRLPADEDGSNPTAAHLVPLLTLIGLSMVTGLVTSGFNAYYWLAVAGAAAALAAYRRELDLALRASAWPAAIGAAVFVAWVVLEPSGGGAAVQEWRAGFAALSPFAAALWLIARVVGSVLVTPIVEELAFRGYLLRRLTAADFTAVSPRLLPLAPLLLSSIAFALVHQRFLAALLAGLAYGFAYTRKGRIGDAILAHAITNALIAAYVLSLGEWGLWL